MREIPEFCRLRGVAVDYGGRFYHDAKVGPIVSLPLERADAQPQQSATGFCSLTAKGRQFIQDIKPFMTSRDVIALARHLRRTDWNEPALIALLTCSDLTVVRAATWALAHVGTMRSNLPLASVLHSSDAATADLAENALWAIWLRNAPSNLHARLCKAIRLQEKDCCEEAIAELDAIISISPTYAEAYNQRAIARFVTEDYAGAAEDYKQALTLNSVHFGAIAGLGHCRAAQGRAMDALNAYRRALEIHPRMEGMRSAIAQIKQIIGYKTATSHPHIRWAMS